MFHHVKREVLSRHQRKRDHFSISDTWSFFHVNAQAQVKALKALRDRACGYPGNLSSMAEWTDILNKMIDGFQAVLDVENLEANNYRENEAECTKRFDAGMKVYVEHYWGLWD